VKLELALHKLEQGLGASAEKAAKQKSELQKVTAKNALLQRDLALVTTQVEKTLTKITKKLGE
jgi:hypothetical protein